MRPDGSNRKKRRVILVVCLAAAVILVSSVFAYRSTNSGSEKTSTRTTSVQEGNSQSTKEKTSKSGESSDENVSSSKNSDDTSTTSDNSKNESDNNKSTGSSSSGQSAASSGSSSSSSQSGSSSASSGSTGGSSQSAKTCTVSIRCDTLVGRSGLSQSVASCVPSSGVILSTRTVTIHSGDTVLAVTERAASAGGVTLVSSKNAMGTYVKGIAGIFEKDVGSASGWMYKVNGSFPSKSCDRYSVSGGETIVWVYTCNGGRDV